MGAALPLSIRTGKWILGLMLGTGWGRWEPPFPDQLEMENIGFDVIRWPLVVCCDYQENS